MIRIVQIALLLAIITPFGMVGAKADDTAGNLLAACQKLDRSLSIEGDMVKFRQDFDTIYCWGFMSAMQESSRISDQREVPLLGACPPAEGTLTQLIKVFIAWGNRNPQHLHRQAAGSVLASFVEAFPCGKTR